MAKTPTGLQESLLAQREEYPTAFLGLSRERMEGVLTADTLEKIALLVRPKVLGVLSGALVVSDTALAAHVDPTSSLLSSLCYQRAASAASSAGFNLISDAELEQYNKLLSGNGDPNVLRHSRKTAWTQEMVEEFERDARLIKNENAPNWMATQFGWSFTPPYKGNKPTVPTKETPFGRLYDWHDLDRVRIEQHVLDETRRAVMRVLRLGV